MKPVTVSDRRLSELSLKMVRQYPGEFKVPLSGAILRRTFGACRGGIVRAYRSLKLDADQPIPAAQAFRKVEPDSALWVLRRLGWNRHHGPFLRAVIADTLEIIAGLRGHEHQRQDLLAVARRLRRKSRAEASARTYLRDMCLPGGQQNDSAHYLIEKVLLYPGMIPTTDFLTTYRPVLAAVIDRRVAA